MGGTAETDERAGIVGMGGMTGAGTYNALVQMLL
jgi:hypothetical protein